MPVKARCGLISLGCAKNLVDSEVMLGLLRERGYEITNDATEADVLIVNTCAFLGAAVEESLDALREVTALKKQGRCQAVIATGCLPSRDVNLIRHNVDGVDALLGSADFPQIVETVEAILERSNIATRQPANGSSAWSSSFVDTQPLIRIEDQRYVYDERTPRLRATPWWYAYIKIAEGCDHRCTFCIIPQLRGRFRSRPMESIVAEARALAKQGVKEIVLIAQDSTRYGVDLYGTSRLADLLRALGEIEEQPWVRVLYAYPTQVTPELIDAMATTPNVCHYIDLPLQHSHPDILRAMWRGGTPESYRRLIEQFRAAMPDVTVRTTLIVGFPGEQEHHFEHLLDFVQEVKFDRIGVFKYSPEDGARSAQYPNQVPEEVKEERYHRLQQTQQRISLEQNRQWVGRILPVLIEGNGTSPNPSSRRRRAGVGAIGRSHRDAPEIDGSVIVKGKQLQPGTVVHAKITKAYEYDLEGLRVEG
ncbi:MAG: 30S ribosomal protein S12 methylthiotransferase RimO [Abditibacteriales bacterium]|nr:30S ribosomal protein S12 methylthiotransferase RimO [Abditibacteriales bacterium]MDW8368243.1 30S ribosomal protein S12 methylthiotransferase RimO [Abditibacteriales bacterium]